MFNLGWGEILLIGIVALIAIGPKELPGVLRTVGQALAKVRRMANEFQGQFQEAMREAEMAQIADFIGEVLAKPGDVAVAESVRARVHALTSRFPLAQ